MKQTRKGYGLGKGMGYKNLMPMDSHIHSLSARGVKSYIVIQGDYKGKTTLAPKEGGMTFDVNTKDLKKYNLSAKGECVHCHMKFSEEDYKKASEGVVGDECLVGDYDNICYPCQLKYGTEKARRLSKLNAKGWTETVNKPDSGGGTQTFVNYKKGRIEVEVERYYDDDKEKYTDYAVFEQIESEDGGSWKGTELETFKTLKKAMEYAKDMLKVYDKDPYYKKLLKLNAKATRFSVKGWRPIKGSRNFWYGYNKGVVGIELDLNEGWKIIGRTTDDLHNRTLKLIPDRSMDGFEKAKKWAIDWAKKVK